MQNHTHSQMCARVQNHTHTHALLEKKVFLRKSCKDSTTNTRESRRKERHFVAAGFPHGISTRIPHMENGRSPIRPTEYLHLHLHLDLSLNRGDCWGTKEDFTTSFLPSSLFSTALWDLANSRPVHSLMLSSHLFLCLSCLLPPFTVPCKMILASPDERET